MYIRYLFDYYLRLVIKCDQSIMSSKTIGAAQFKAQCLALLDELEADGIIVTKHGKPVARVLPIPSAPSELIGRVATASCVHGDTFSTGETWNANAES